jgi:hypothetical protein
MPVSLSSSSTGTGSTITTSYRYGGFNVDLSGRGFLGFRWSEATNDATGFTLRSEFRQYWPYAGLPSVVRKTQISGAVLSQATYTHGCINPHPAMDTGCTVTVGNRYFPFLSQSIETAAISTARRSHGDDQHQLRRLRQRHPAVTVGTSDGYSKTTTSALRATTCRIGFWGGLREAR